MARSQGTPRQTTALVLEPIGRITAAPEGEGLPSRAILLRFVMPRTYDCESPFRSPPGCNRDVGFSRSKGYCAHACNHSAYIVFLITRRWRAACAPLGLCSVAGCWSAAPEHTPARDTSRGAVVGIASTTQAEAVCLRPRRKSIGGSLVWPAESAVPLSLSAEHGRPRLGFGRLLVLPTGELPTDTRATPEFSEVHERSRPSPSGPLPPRRARRRPRHAVRPVGRRENMSVTNARKDAANPHVRLGSRQRATLHETPGRPPSR